MSQNTPWGFLRVGNTRLPLTSNPSEVGRDPACHVVLNDTSISRRQARLQVRGGRVLLENLSQTNPTRIRGILVTGSIDVNAGEMIELGGIQAELVLAPAAHCIQCGKILSRPDAPFCSHCGAVQHAAPVSPALSNSSSSGTQRIAAAELVIHTPGHGIPQRVLLDKPTLKLGRAADNDIIINHPLVSAHHATLEAVGVHYRIIDLGTPNGLVYNGQRIQERVLSNNDSVRIGDSYGNSISLTFVALAAPAPAILRPLDIRQPITIIGRDPQAGLRLDSPTVSWHHARIDFDGQRHALADLKSTNGTYVNGARIRQRVLQPGDVVQIGSDQLVYEQGQLSQFNVFGNVRLDALALHRAVQTHKGQQLLLNDVTLSIYPREFVAFVGASGAGKSTLMNALSGFQPVQGQVLLNGADFYKLFEMYRPMLGYVPQDDIIHNGLPVESALRYSAALRLPPDISHQEARQRIDDVLATVNLTAQRDQMVQSLSGGQRKRVSIAVELLAQPPLFFLDEPTSGLDPGLEKKMMVMMRQLADMGRTVILVTHATANISQCDHVAFLARGRLVFFGPPDEAKAFFNAADFSDIYSELEQVPNLADPDQAPREWEQRFKQSPIYQQYVAGRIQHPPQAPPTAQLANQAAQRPRPSLLWQWWILTRRYLELIMRDWMALGVLLAVMPLIGVLLDIVAGPNYLTGLNRADPLTHQNAQIVLFMLALASILFGLFSSSFEIVRERTIYRRERMVNLGVLPYMLSKVLVLLGFSILQTLLLLFIVSLRVQFPERGILFPYPAEIFLTLILAALASLMLGLTISTYARNETTVIYSIFFVLFMQILFAGNLVDIPQSVQFLSWLTINHWTLNALGSSTGLWEYRIHYDHTAPHLLQLWLALSVFVLALGTLVYIGLRRKRETH